MNNCKIGMEILKVKFWHVHLILPLTVLSSQFSHVPKYIA